MEDLVNKRAFNEILAIINHLEPALKINIPEHFIEFLEDNKDKQYNYKYDEKKEIDEQTMLEDTKAILSLIYRDYICIDEEEKKELEDIWNQNEIKYQKQLNEKYNSEYLFKSKKNPDRENINELDLKIYKENIWVKIIKFIKEKICTKNNRGK